MLYSSSKYSMLLLIFMSVVFFYISLNDRFSRVVCVLYQIFQRVSETND